MSGDGRRPAMGIAKIPAVIWLLGVVLALGVSVSPAEGAKTRHHDFFVSLFAFIPIHFYI